MSSTRGVTVTALRPNGGSPLAALTVVRLRGPPGGSTASARRCSSTAATAPSRSGPIPARWASRSSAPPAEPVLEPEPEPEPAPETEPRPPAALGDFVPSFAGRRCVPHASRSLHLLHACRAGHHDILRHVRGHTRHGHRSGGSDGPLRLLPARAVHRRRAAAGGPAASGHGHARPLVHVRQRERAGCGGGGASELRRRREILTPLPRDARVA